MSRTGTWFLAIVALLLLGFIFFAPQSWRRAPLGAGDYVLRFDTAEVRSVEIVRDGEILRFQRLPDGWDMGPRPADRAQTAAVERMLEAAQLLRILDRIRAEEVTPEEEKKLGFAPPRQTLRLETPHGTEVLLLGREGAGEGRIFVRSGESPHTYLVGDELQQLLLLPTESFRDPRLVALPANRIERLRLSRAEGTVELQKQGGRWHLVRPLQARADTELVEKSLEHILGARIFSFQSNGLPTEGTEALGLIELWPEGEDQPLRLQVLAAEPTKDESPSAEERVLIWHEGRQATMEVAADNFALLRLPPDQLRSRQLADLDPDLIDRITVQKDGEELGLRRNDLDGWHVLSGAGEKDVSTTWVEQLWEMLNQARVEQFLLAGAPGLPEAGSTAAPPIPPTAEISFDSWLSENTPEAPAGRHPLLQVKLWVEESAEPGPAKVLARLHDEAGGRLVASDFWEKFQQWWQQRPTAAAAEAP